MGPLPQYFQDLQTLLWSQAGVVACVGLIGFLETAEDADYFLHTSFYPVPCYDTRTVHIQLLSGRSFTGQLD